MANNESWVVSASSVADEVRTIETPLILPTSNFSFDANYSHKLASHVRVDTRYIRNYVINNAVVNANFMVAYKDGLGIQESLYGVSDETIIQSRPVSATVVSDLEGKIGIYAFVWTAVNFYHWLTQIITSIESVLSYRNEDDVVIITDRNLSHWQESSLAMLGYDRVKRFALQPNIHYQIPLIEISDFYRRPTTATRTGLQVCKRLKLAANLRASKSRKIYVSRKDVKFRRVINEDDLISLLRLYGFDILVVGSLSLKEQIEWFHDAAVVVGSHGQGMCHVAYCNEGTLVWEIFPDKFITQSTVGIAAMCGLRYHASACDQIITADQSPQLTDFLVDLDFVESQLNEFGLTKNESN